MPFVESLTDVVARPSMNRARRCSVAVLNEALHEGSDGTLALGSLELGWVDAVVQGLAKVHCRNEANKGNNKESSNLTIGQAILLWNWHHQTQLLGALASWHSGQQDLSISHVIGPSWQCHGSCSHSCSTPLATQRVHPVGQEQRLKARRTALPRLLPWQCIGPSRNGPCLFEVLFEKLFEPKPSFKRGKVWTHARNTWGNSIQFRNGF